MKKLIWAILASSVIFNGVWAYADSITGFISGDNNISYWNGTSWVAEGTNWRNSEPLNFTVNTQSDIVYFAVSNDVQTSGNPSGLLASFTDNTGNFSATRTNKLLSNSSNFLISAQPAWLNNPVEGVITLGQINPPNTDNPSKVTLWEPTINYGANGDPTTIWQNVLGGPVPNIDANAQWIWDANNDQYYASEDDYAFLAVDLGVNDGSNGSSGSPVVPEPPTLLLFIFAGVLLIAFYRRRPLQVA